ncbi:MFS transporter [Streptomyces sp. NPDC058195]|uniref:MFS transporter n=1 Tax=Streptomyces sp. NPDC058195 TaxID=3346375 RepID=UPI0036E398AF
MSQPVPLSKNRNFRLLWSANALSTLGSQAAFIALPLLVLSLTGSVTDFGLVLFVESVVSVVAGLPAGVLVDRVDRRKVMLVCDGLRALISAVFVVAMVTDRVSLTLVIAAGTLTGISSSPFGPAAGAMLRSVVPPEQLVSAYAVNQARNSAIVLAGPLIGAALYGISPTLPFLVDAVSYLASAACVLALRPPERPRPRPRPPADRSAADRKAAAFPQWRRDLTTGLRFVRASPFMRYTLVNSTLMNFAMSAVVVTLIAVHSGAGSTPMSTGLLVAVSGAGNLLGAALAPRLNRLLSPRRLVLAVGWSTAVLVPAMAADDAIWWTLLLIAGSSVTAPAANIALAAAAAHAIPDHLQGRVRSTSALLPAVVTPLGPVAAGLLTDRLSAPAALLLFGGMLFALACFSTLSHGLRLIPDLRRPTAEGPSGSATDDRVPEQVR